MNKLYYTPSDGYYITTENDTGFHFASFSDYAQFLNFTTRFKLRYSNPQFFRDCFIFDVNKRITDKLFWKMSELPRCAHKIKALSNGRIVDCYYTMTRRTITFYRPNPNASDIYKPLSTRAHIKHQRDFGIY